MAQLVALARGRGSGHIVDVVIAVYGPLCQSILYTVYTLYYMLYTIVTIYYSS